MDLSPVILEPYVDSSGKIGLRDKDSQRPLAFVEQLAVDVDHKSGGQVATLKVNMPGE